MWTSTRPKWNICHFHLVLNLSLSWFTLFVLPFQRIGAHVGARWQPYIMDKHVRGRKKLKKIILIQKYVEQTSRVKPFFPLATIKHSKVLPVNVTEEGVIFIRRDWRRKPLEIHLELGKKYMANSWYTLESNQPQCSANKCSKKQNTVGVRFPIPGWKEKLFTQIPGWRTGKYRKVMENTVKIQQNTL